MLGFTLQKQLDTNVTAKARVALWMLASSQRTWGDEPAVNAREAFLQIDEEWYTLDRDPANVTGVTVLLIAHDNAFPDRPSAWVHDMPGGGRVFYTALGHDVSAFREPQFMKFFGGRHQVGRARAVARKRSRVCRSL